jgi:hypothetical protein
LLLSSCRKSSANFQHNRSTYRHDLDVGASARDLLSDSLYNSLQIEVQYIDDPAPSQPALNFLQAMLAARINKPGGITIQTKKIRPSSDLFTLDGIKGIEEKNRTVFTNGRNLGVYVLLLNGYYVGDSVVMGTAYRNTSVVLFGQAISDHSSNNMGIQKVLQATTMEHLFGHLMGLVDEGAPMQVNHRDALHGYHCNNEHCLMYYGAIDANFAAAQWASVDSIPGLDSNCVNDLRDIGGK